MNNQQIIKATEELVTKLTAPAKQLNALVVEHIEQLSRFQLKTLETYTDLGLEQLKAALQVDDAKALQAYVKNQGKVVETLSRKLSADGEALARLNQSFAVSVQKLAQESAQQLAKPAKAA